MPGHKGVNFLGLENFDITEFDGADCLYHADGIIRESEENASQLFGAHTFYSAEGSSLSVKAMIYLAIKANFNGQGKPLVVAGRNAHKSFISAVGLLDAEVKWIYPEDSSYVSCSVDADKLKNVLSGLDKKPVAVYLTSPDYLGNTLSLAEISKVCKEFGTLLLVDNAHGAYLKFLPTSEHPIDLGADMCCDSAHKTLPALTGAGYLHLSKSMPDDIVNSVKSALALFGSTSPSYLILQSLDLLNRYLFEGYKDNLASFITKLDGLKSKLTKHGYRLVGNEPLKITLAVKPYGYNGIEFSKILKEHNALVEFYDPDFVVMMFTIESNDTTLNFIEKLLLSIPKKPAIDTIAPTLCATTQVMSIREALLSKSVTLSIDKAKGKILADTSVGCPPAVPIAVCGERLTEHSIELFKYYGINKCKVVLE